MEQFISKKDNNLEFSALAVDYLINDFITYLKENSLFENTSIFLVDFIKTDDINAFIAKNRVKLTTLNTTSVD